MYTHRLISLLVLYFISTTIPAANCTPTPHRTTGTHYEPVTMQKIDVGQGLNVRGRILAAPDCVPIANAKIAHWQADENGYYVAHLRAYLFSGNDGSYQFETEWPNLTPPHIHFIVTADGYEVLETQWRGEERINSIEFDIILQRTQ